MKKVNILISLTLMIVAVITVLYIEKNNKTPQERYAETAGLNRKALSEDSLLTGEEKSTKILNQTNTIEYEFLSYEIVDDYDVVNIHKYNKNSFIEGDYPDLESTIEIIDYSAMRKDYPSVNEYIESNGEKGMTAAEYQEFLNQHLEEYRTSKHLNTKYVFIRCKIKNISTSRVNEIINDVRVFAMCEGKTKDIEEINGYFDHSQHTEGEDRIHSFFHYTFEPGESIECVIACKFADNRIDFSKNISYYIGFEPIGLDDPYRFDPSLDDNFVPICTLTKGSCA